MKNKIVILAGSGHANLEIVKSLDSEEIAKHRFILISPHRRTYYSGLIPSFLAREIDEKSLIIDSAEFAESKGIQFIQGEVQAVDQIGNTVTLKSGGKLKFDLLSLNIGGTPIKIPSDDCFKTLHLRPFDEFLPKWQGLQRIFNTSLSPRFVVVGGGAAAVEVAAALRVRLNKNQTKVGEVHLVSRGSRLCENYSRKISKKIEQSLLRQGIKIHLNEPVNQIYQDYIKLNQFGELDFDSIFIVTPNQSSNFLANKVDSKLRISSNVFAAGDATEMLDHPRLPRSGVVAVSQGRHLADSIRRILKNSEPVDFKISDRQINILITGKLSAVFVWGKFSFEGRWPYILKKWIDRRYMKGFV